MVTRDKGFVHLFLILIIAVIGISTLGYFAYKSGRITIKPENGTSNSPNSPTPTPENNNWKVYDITPDYTLGYESYQLKVPGFMRQIEHSSNFQTTETFQDEQRAYILTIEQQKNYNSQTKKPFANLKELTGLNYEVEKTFVGGQEAAKVLPRAGSETTYGVLFFSKSNKVFFKVTLETPVDGSKLNDGKVLFSQILSTFKFHEMGTCRPTYNVGTNSPELTAEMAYSEKCLEKQTEKECLKVDYYNLSQNDFSTPDGISDCKWTKIPECKQGENLKECKLGPCCCPAGAICD